MTSSTEKLSPLEVFAKIVEYHAAVGGDVITDHVTHKVAHWNISVTGVNPSIDQAPVTAMVTSDKHLGCMSVGIIDGVATAHDMEDLLIEDLEAAIAKLSSD